MNAAQIHLAITHFPIAGILIGVFLLAFGRLRKDGSLLKAANILFICCALIALVASVTGEGAEEILEKIGDYSIKIHEHEDAAQQAIWSSCLLGIVSLVSLFYEYRLKKPIIKINAVILILAIITFAFMSRAGHKGALIKHPEIESSASENQG